MPLNWTLANRGGILWDADHSEWRGGHVSDVLELDASSILVASHTGGLWHVSLGFGLPLSTDWDAPDTICLARGPYGGSHLYSGGADRDGKGAL
jgi:hypothetical protein